MPRRGAKGWRAYAIGDVHGRYDLLQGLLKQIQDDHAARPAGAKPMLIFLGDLIDRGPDSRAVVDHVSRGALPDFKSVALAGNHEEVLLRVLDGEEGLLAEWLQFGGVECLASYSVDADQLMGSSEERAVARIRSAIPPEHRRFLHDMADSFQFGDYLFVHAGIRPGIPLQRQSPVDLRWIREPFLSDRRNHGSMIVHGHTITEQVDERPNRIGIDTGSYRFGVITALGIEGEQRWYLQQSEQEQGTQAVVTT